MFSFGLFSAKSLTFVSPSCVTVRQGNLVLEVPLKEPRVASTVGPTNADWNYMWVPTDIDHDPFKKRVEEFLNANRPRRGGISCALSPGNPSNLHIWARRDGDGPKWTARTIPACGVLTLRTLASMSF